MEYLLVGGYSVILHGYQRSTGDMDIWVNPTTDNYLKLRKSFQIFGLPIEAIPIEEFLNTDLNDVFSFGRPPFQIEILTKVKGLEFDIANRKKVEFELDGDLFVKSLCKSDLILAKKAAARHRDLDDLEHLE